MDNEKNSPNKKMMVAPSVNNDQLGENASLEFAEDYDNKSNDPPKKNEDLNQK